MNTADSAEFRLLRKKMVEEQLIPNGIVQKELINAFLNVPRHKFVPEEHIYKSYKDTPLPIGYFVALVVFERCGSLVERCIFVGVTYNSHVNR